MNGTRQIDLYDIVMAMKNTSVPRRLMTAEEIMKLFEDIKKTPIELEKGSKENED